jgi:hypothetical protein
MIKKKLSLKLSSFEEMGELSIEEKIDRLGQEIMANAFYVMDRIGMEGKKSSKLEIELQEEAVRQFNYIKKTYDALMKMNRISTNPKNNTDFEKGLMEKMRETKSTLGSIVTAVPKS